MKWTTIGLLAAASLSCDPRRFDDLEGTAWVQLAERNDGQASGDWAIDVIAMPPASGKQGMIYVLSLGGPPPGLAQVTFDEHGNQTDQIGTNFQGGGAGLAGPLDDKASVDALAPFGATQFIAGAGDKPNVVRLDVGIKNGASILPQGSGLTKVGRAVATGNLGLGSTTPDVAVQGTLSLSIIPGGDPTKIKTCNTKQANGAPSGTLYIGWESLQLAPVKKNGHDQIVMSGYKIDQQAATGQVPFIWILDAADVQNGADCPANGFQVAEPAPQALAVADVDMDGNLDLVTGAAAQSGSAGTVIYYKGPLTGGSAPTPVTVPATAADSASFLRGNRIKIADLDGDGKPEVIVADSGASLNNVNESGQVHIYKTGTCTDATTQRGPFCLATTLYDSTPSNKDQFGRALAVTPFPTPDSKTYVLGVVEKSKLWVFFKIFPSSTDPRVK
jgi:hypothetical protein